MLSGLGLNRSLDTKDVLPVFAWRLDINSNIGRDEIRIQVTDIHLENANLKQIYNDANGNPDGIRENILSIVEKRGKLHNPFTGTGGLISGRVEEVGIENRHFGSLFPGDEILVLTSATSIPLSITAIKSVDIVYGHLEVEGYAILFEKFPIVKKPGNLPMNLLMMAFEESASVWHVNQLAEKEEKVLVLGSDPITTMLYGSGLKHGSGSNRTVIALLHQESNAIEENIGHSKIDILERVFDEVHIMNLADPISCAREIQKYHSNFSLVVNCASVLGAESISVLVTKEKGTIFISTLLNNYHYALFLAEAINKEVKLLSADGYTENYDAFMFSLLEQRGNDIIDLASWIKRNSKSENQMEKPTYLSQLSPPNEEKHIGQSFGLIYKSKNMRELVDDLLRVAQYDCPVLITGETGVGKEKFAKVLHANSSRKLQASIKVNCASISPSLMESEFFGYESEAFTGASKEGKKGFFELAHNGILLLDEISELSLDLQAKLLRVLQEGEFYKVGGQKIIKTDVRIIAASNQDLVRLVELGKFREDLYYRLAVYVLNIPPLRQRTSDIEPITDHILKNYNEKYGFNKHLAKEGMKYLMDYEWPGNIRELDNLIHRLVINSKGNSISASEILQELYYNNRVSENILVQNGKGIKGMNPFEEKGGYPIAFNNFISEQERVFIQHYLEKYKTTRKAAEAMGIAQSQLMRKKKKYNL